MDKSEYLKRYLSNDSGSKKVKVKKKVVTTRNIRIIDHDVDLKSLEPKNLSDDDLDNEPVVAVVVDERPKEVQELERFRKDNRWKVLGSVDERIESSQQKSTIVQRQRHDSDSDSRDQLTSIRDKVERRRHDSDSDAGSDLSPARKSAASKNSDLSPPRKSSSGAARNISMSKGGVGDLSPPRKRNRKDSDSSPPRRNARHDSDNDQSVERKPVAGQQRSSRPATNKDSNSDLSPKRRKRNDSDSDLSPPRKKTTDDDLSPPRRKGSDGDLSPPRRQTGKMEKTLSGAKAGLSSAAAMKDEVKLLKAREDEAFNKYGAELLGKGAKAVVRGRLKAKEEEKAKQEEKMAKMKEKYDAWGKGLVQSRMQAAAVGDAVHEVDKPLARYRDDEDLDKLQREEEREGDPMLAFLHKKKEKTDGNKTTYPAYKGPQPPPNRFNIRPGYRWDGVNRSNGFENKLFATQTKRRVQEDEANKWSVEDM